MKRYLQVDPGQIDDTARITTSNGVNLKLHLSPFDTPVGICAFYDEKSKRLQIEFQYIDDEPPAAKTLNYQDVTIREGLHSGKLLSVSVPSKTPPNTAEAMTVVHEVLSKAFEDRLRRIQSKIGQSMNQEFAFEVLEKNLDELAGVP